MEIKLINNAQLTSVAETRFNSPSIKKIEEVNMKTKISEQISLAYYKCRYNIEEEDLLLMSSMFYDEIIKLYPWLTIHELEHCFNQGYREVYGEYQGLSIKTFLMWIAEYEKMERSAMLIKAKENLPSVPALPEITEAQKLEIVMNGLKDCFKNYKETGNIDTGRLYLYEFLDEKNLMPKDKMTKKGIYSIAKKNITKKKESAITREEKATYNLLDKLGNPSNKLISECKRLSLLNFFNDHASIDQILNKVK